MKSLLILDQQFNANTNDMWRTAIHRKWSTERGDPRFIQQQIEGYDFIRYYGNMLHIEEIKKFLPLDFPEIPPRYLANLEAYTKRNITLLMYIDILEPLPIDIFVKPVGIKWFEAKVYKAGDTVGNETCKYDDFVYTSEIVKYRNEVRCFVLNGEILTSSEYIIDGKIYDTYEDLEPEDINFDARIDDSPLRQYVREICHLCPDLPDGIVIDFGLTYDGEWQLIEFNEAWASGLYWCDADKCLDVVIASQNDK